MQRLFFVTTPLAQRVMLLGFALIIAVLFGTTMRTDTASAAYLDEYCSFELSTDANSITAECTDDEGNGTIDGATFTSVNEVYVLVQSGESQVRCTRATNNSECPPTDESKSLSCKSTITLDKQTNAIGYVDGEYLTKERGGGGSVVVNSKCSPLLSDGTYKKKDQAITISISRYRLEQIKTKTNNALISSFKDRFESQCESEVEGVPAQGGQRETAYNDCIARYRKAITTCNGAALATFQLNEFFDTNESKENYKKLLKNCFEDEAFNVFSQNLKNSAANAAVAAIGKTESENPSLEADYPGATGNNATDENTSCAIDGIGWMICPVMNFLADANEKAFGFLQNLLEIRPSLVQDEATVDAWSRFRDLANIAFVIAFLIIIYSQITSVGISNYGIKKLLPKIAASAILVNLSLFICQVLVDVSNIAGASLYSFIENIAPVTSATADDSSWTNVMTGLLAAGVTVLLIAAIVLAPTVLLALGLILLILVARQAFILILVVIAPLAFVAYLLPNTEQWFKKWWKALSAMLLVYPIIAVVFGASTLASNILMRIADGTRNEDDSQLLAIVALGVMAIPLFAVPALLKGAMAGAGSIGARLQGMADKSQSRASAKGKARFNESAAGQYMQYRQQRKATNRALSRGGQKTGSNKNPLNWRRNATAAVMGRVNNSSLSGGFGDRLAAAGTALADKEWDEEVGRQKTSMSSMSNEKLLEVMADKSASHERRAAAAGMVMSRGHRGSHLKALEIAHSGRGGDDAEAMHGIQKQMAHDMKDSPFALGDQSAGALQTGDYGSKDSSGTVAHMSPREELKKRVGTKLSAKGVASMNPDELKSIHKMARNGELSASELTNLQAKITEMRTDPQYMGSEKPEATLLYDELLSGTYATNGGGTSSAHYNDDTVF